MGGYGLDGRKIGVRVHARARYFFSMSSKPVLGPTYSPTQWAPGANSPRAMGSGSVADHFQLLAVYMDLYVHSPIHLHDVL